MELTGSVIIKGETETVGNSGFEKRLLVIKTDEQYPQTIPFDFVQGKVNLLENIQFGDNVKVSVNVRGNEYNGKYYVSLNGWKIEKL